SFARLEVERVLDFRLEPQQRAAVLAREQFVPGPKRNDCTQLLLHLVEVPLQLGVYCPHFVQLAVAGHAASSCSYVEVADFATCGLVTRCTGNTRSPILYTSRWPTCSSRGRPRTGGSSAPRRSTKRG